MIAFALASVVALASTFMTVTRRNAVHALLYFILSLFSVAVIFLVLGAPFAAALELIVYAGAIMVLFVFVVMIIGAGEVGTKPSAWIGPFLLGLPLFAAIALLVLSGSDGSQARTVVGSKQVGFALFGPYVLGAEVTSFLLISALVGAFHIGRGGKP
jgi:NADH-quinone oxidoreductase subunit J